MKPGPKPKPAAERVRRLHLSLSPSMHARYMALGGTSWLRQALGEPTITPPAPAPPAEPPTPVLAAYSVDAASDTVTVVTYKDGHIAHIRRLRSGGDPDATAFLTAESLGSTDIYYWDGIGLPMLPEELRQPKQNGEGTLR